jgi:hypothetical protein
LRPLAPAPVPSPAPPVPPSVLVPLWQFPRSLGYRPGREQLRGGADLLRSTRGSPAESSVLNLGSYVYYHIVRYSCSTVPLLLNRKWRVVFKSISTPPFSRRWELFSKIGHVGCTRNRNRSATNMADFWKMFYCNSVFNQRGRFLSYIVKKKYFFPWGFSVTSVGAGKIFELDFPIHPGFIQSLYKLAIFTCP